MPCFPPNCAANWIPTQHWGEAYDLNKLEVDWHVPSAEELEYGYKVCARKAWRRAFCLSRIYRSGSRHNTAEHLSRNVMQ